MLTIKLFMQLYIVHIHEFSWNLFILPYYCCYGNIWLTPQSHPQTLHHMSCKKKDNNLPLTTTYIICSLQFQLLYKRIWLKQNITSVYKILRRDKLPPPPSLFKLPNLQFLMLLMLMSREWLSLSLSLSLSKLPCQKFPMLLMSREWLHCVATCSPHSKHNWT